MVKGIAVLQFVAVSSNDRECHAVFEGARQAADQGQTWKFDHTAAVAAFKQRKA